VRDVTLSIPPRQASQVIVAQRNTVEGTKIDYISGKIVSLGAKYHIATPVSVKLVELVKEATARKAGSPKLSPDELLKATGLLPEDKSH
jgi:hypothetical protein